MLWRAQLKRPGCHHQIVSNNDFSSHSFALMVGGPQARCACCSNKSCPFICKFDPNQRNTRDLLATITQSPTSTSNLKPDHREHPDQRQVKRAKRGNVLAARQGCSEERFAEVVTCVRELEHGICWEGWYVLGVQFSLVFDLWKYSTSD